MSNFVRPDPLDIIYAQAEDQRRRTFAAIALRGLADLIEKAEITTELIGNDTQTRGACVLGGLSFGFEVGDYLTQIIVTEDASISKHPESDGEGMNAGNGVISDGHMAISIEVDVERIA